jgi:hypothetical protein
MIALITVPGMFPLHGTHALMHAHVVHPSNVITLTHWQ